MLYGCLFTIVLPISVAVLFGRIGALLTGRTVVLYIPGLVLGLLIGLVLARIVATPLFQRMKGQHSAASDTFYGNLGWAFLVVAVIATAVLFLV